jgi:hypothetical protein
VRTVGVAWGAFAPEVLREAGATEILALPGELVRLAGPGLPSRTVATGG